MIVREMYCSNKYMSALGFDRTQMIKALIKEAKGKVIAGTYVKTNGELRAFNGREVILGAISNGKSLLKASQVAYIDNTVYLSLLKEGLSKSEAAKKSWRSFKSDKLKELKINSTKYTFDVEI